MYLVVYYDKKKINRTNDEVEETSTYSAYKSSL